MNIKLLIIALVVILLFVVSVQFFLSYRYISIGEKVAENSVKFERVGDDFNRRVLFVGDSTVFGVGAPTPEQSVAGYFAETYPNTEIINRGENGAKASDIPRLIQGLENEKFDLIVLLVGGNDSVRFTSEKVLEDNLRNDLNMLTQMSENVIWGAHGDLGTVRVFPAFVRPLMTWKTKKNREIFLKVASGYERVSFVDFYFEDGEDPFTQEPEKHYTKDFFHPNENGYRVWFEKINEAVKDIGF